MNGPCGRVFLASRIDTWPTCHAGASRPTGIPSGKAAYPALSAGNRTARTLALRTLALSIWCSGFGLRRGFDPLPECAQLRRIGAAFWRDQIEAGVSRQRNLEGHHEPALGDVVPHIGGAAERDAKAVDRSLDGHEDEVEAQATLFRDRGRQAGRCQPQPPVVVIGAAG